MRSQYINKLINLVAKNGNKHKSEGRILQSFKKLQKNSLKQPYTLLKTAVKRLLPIYRLQTLTDKKRRKKNKTVKKKACLVLSASYRLTLAIKYITGAIRKQKAGKLCNSLAQEVLSTCQGSSDALNLKLEDHQQVKSHKFYIRRYYRWVN
jgi:ribosomal protein S7